MSDHISSLIIPGAIAVRNSAEKLANGINAGDFAKKPVINGKAIECNHPAFVFGHLSLYPARIFKLLEVEDPSVLPPQNYYDLFAIGAQCNDDSERKLYPPKEELVSFLLKSTDIVLKKLPTIPQERFYAKNVEERSKDRFSLVGSFVVYLLGAHANGHLGQVSTWRRCMGLAPV